MRFEWIAALRFLREGRAQSLLIIAGVTVGVAVIVFLTALISGLQADLIAKTLGSQAHIVLRPPEDTTPRLITSEASAVNATVERRAQRLRSIEQWQQVEMQLQREAGVVAISPMASGPGFALRGNATKAIAIIGIAPERYAHIVDIPSKMLDGTFRVGGNDAVIGRELSLDLGLRVGDKFRVESPAGVSETLIVAGTFDIGVKDLNRRWVITSLRIAQNLLELRGGVTNIDLSVNDIFAASAIADRIAGNHNLIADSWMKTNAQLMIGLRSQSASSSMIQFFIVVAVAFGIASVLVVSVVQKSKEIGILRAMGARRHSVLIIFLLQGGIVGLLGSLFGSLLGAGLAMLFAMFAQGPGGGALFPIDLNALLFIKATAVATVTGVVSASIPALRASRLDPVVAIRYG